MKIRFLLLPALLALLFPLTSSAETVVSVSVAPPVLQVEEQPLCPVDGYIWQPGYWAYDGYNYYWVPGQWVAPPQVGYLWTPGYWGFVNGLYLFSAGYWGPTVGYYGGINYGFGYYGSGYAGGRWEGNQFRYNTAVSRVDPKVIHNTFEDRSAVRQGAGRRVSYNGPGGTSAQPTAAQRAAVEQHRPKVTPQMAEAAKANQPAGKGKNPNLVSQQTRQSPAVERSNEPKKKTTAVENNARGVTTRDSAHVKRQTHNEVASAQTHVKGEPRNGGQPNGGQPKPKQEKAAKPQSKSEEKPKQGSPHDEGR